MRISDWSSDVGSSDLLESQAVDLGGGIGELAGRVGELLVEILVHGGLLRGVRQGLPVFVRCSITPGLLQCNRSEEHTSELQSLMRISYAVFCLKKKKTKTQP